MLASQYKLFALLPLAALFIGCGQSEAPLSHVEGTVLLDGQPLANAIVEFQPDDKSGKARPSIGETGPNGKYKLRHTKHRYGALRGKHKVLITTFSPSGDGQFKERVPAIYNKGTTLTREVELSANWHDFDLQSSPTNQQTLASDR